MDQTKCYLRFCFDVEARGQDSTILRLRFQLLSHLHLESFLDELRVDGLYGGVWAGGGGEGGGGSGGTVRVARGGERCGVGADLWRVRERRRWVARRLARLREGDVDDGVEDLRCVGGVTCGGGGWGCQAAVEADAPGRAHPEEGDFSPVAGT